MFSEDIYTIHGTDGFGFGGRVFDPSDIRQPVLVASICDNDQRIIEEYRIQREDAMDDQGFRSMRRMMLSNRGVCH